MLHGQTGRLGQLFERRLARELGLEPPGDTRELLPALDNVDRDSNDLRVVRNRALHRLADPPRRVRRELEPAPPVELLDRAVQADRALLDQVEERNTQSAVALGDRDDEPKVRLDHPPLRGGVAALDPLGERDLLRRRQEPTTPDLDEKQLEGVEVRRPLTSLGLDHATSLVRGRESAYRPRGGSTGPSRWTTG